MICIKCNSQVEDGVKFCPVCGANLVEDVNHANFDAQSNFNSMSSDKVNVLLVIISVFIPLVGFILFFAYKSKSPKTAKYSGIAALASFLVSFIISILLGSLLIFNFSPSPNEILNDNNDVVENSNDDTVVEENDSTDSNQTQSENKSTISNDWKQYQIDINGKIYTLPMTYLELSTATGFSMKETNASSNLENNHYALVNLYKNDKLALYIEIINKTGDVKKYTECNVSRVSQSKYQVSQGAQAIIFPGGIKVGDSITDEQVVALLGTANDVKDYGTSKQYMYLSDTSWTTINNYKIKITNGVVEELSLDHRG